MAIGKNIVCSYLTALLFSLTYSTLISKCCLEYVWQNGCCREVRADSLRTQLGMYCTADTGCKLNPTKCSRRLCEELCKKLSKRVSVIACQHKKFSNRSVGNDCVAVHGALPEVKPPKDPRITECQCAIIGKCFRMYTSFS